jgi:hypothetical protein
VTRQTADLLLQLIDGTTVSPSHPQAVALLAALLAARAEVLAAADTDDG